jgi:peptidoglycan L-alanyl-D-glutamate endopeptidase CwlK
MNGTDVTWEFKKYKELAAVVKQAAQAVGVPIEWGGDWKTFLDGPHFQLPWKEYP